MPVVAVKGHQASYDCPVDLSQKRGKTILFLHGAAWSRKIFRDQLQFLSKQYTPIALDLPGHGNSSGNGATSISEYRDYVKAFVDQLSLAPLVLGGHSIGGIISLDYAVHYPQDLVGLVLLGAPVKTSVTIDQIERMRREPNVVRQENIDHVFSKKTPLDLVAQMAKDNFATPIETVLNNLRALTNVDQSDAPGKIALPTLLIYGEEEPQRVLDQAKQLKSELANSKLVMVPNAAHMTSAEQPGLVNAAIKQFLDSLD